MLDLPFAPGEAPYRVKGNAYLGHYAYLESHYPGGEAAHHAALEQLHPVRGPKLRDFFEQKFLASAWYDVFPLATAGIAFSAAVKLPYIDYIRKRSDAQAELDVTGVHRLLLRFVSPKKVTTRAPAIVGQYFDFASVESQMHGPEHFTCYVRGVPLALGPWYATVLESYLHTVLRYCGVSNPAVRCVRYEPSAAQTPLPEVTLHIEVRMGSARAAG